MPQRLVYFFYLTAIALVAVSFQSCGISASISADSKFVELTTQAGPISKINLKRNDPTQMFGLDLTIDMHPVPGNAGANPQATMSGAISRHIGGPSGPDCLVTFNNEPIGDLIRVYSDGITFTHRNVVCMLPIVAGQSVDVKADYVDGHSDSGAYVVAGSCAYGDVANLPSNFISELTRILLARNSNGCIPADPLLAQQACPIVDCAAPPAGCSYSGSGPVDSNGCPTSCGQLVCQTQ